MCLGASAAEPLDTLAHDTISSADNELGIIRRTVRGFDRTDDDYIEPQHYEFTVMGQITRTFESFILKSNGQSVRLAPDGLTKIGPYFGWRWFFLGYTFDIKNIGFSQNGLRKEFDLSIYSSQVGIDLFYRRTGDDYKIRDVRLGYGIDGRLFEGLPCLLHLQSRPILVSCSIQSEHLSEDKLWFVDGRSGIYRQHPRHELRQA